MATKKKRPHNRQDTVQNVPLAATRPDSGPLSMIRETQYPVPSADGTLDRIGFSRGEERTNSSGNEGSSAAVGSPVFAGFQSPPKEQSQQHGTLDSISVPDEAEQEASGASAPDPNESNATNHVDAHADTNEKRVSPPRQSGNFLDRLLGLLADGESQESPGRVSGESHGSESPHSPSQASSEVPNPFSEFDKPYRVLRRKRLREVDDTPRTNLEHSDGRDHSSAASASDLETIEGPPSAQRVESRHGSGHTPPNPTQDDDVVDLTGSSPPASLQLGSDYDRTESPKLPGGPGWVQKSNPTSQPRSRSPMHRHIQVMQEVSISPPQNRRDSLRRRPREKRH